MPEETYGWVTMEEAETYMSLRLNAAAYWHSGISKEAALMTAYNYLVNSGLFSFPDDASDNMKTAQFETALFLLQHLEDMDARLGLQAQGVRQAGVVQESYEVADLPLPNTIGRLLTVYKVENGFRSIEIERDDDE